MSARRAAMSAKTFTATFSFGPKGTINSSREYTHAYLVRATGRMGTIGFASSLAKAVRASRSDNLRYYDGKGDVEIVEVVQP